VSGASTTHRSVPFWQRSAPVSGATFAPPSPRRSILRSCSCHSCCPAGRLGLDLHAVSRQRFRPRTGPRWHGVPALVLAPQRDACDRCDSRDGFMGLISDFHCPRGRRRARSYPACPAHQSPRSPPKYVGRPVQGPGTWFDKCAGRAARQLVSNSPTQGSFDLVKVVTASPNVGRSHTAAPAVTTTRGLDVFFESPRWHGAGGPKRHAGLGG
jgi:hypothetical protein